MFFVDANNLGRDVLGHDTDLDERTLEGVFADNPLGQGREQTRSRSRSGSRSQSRRAGHEPA